MYCYVCVFGGEVPFPRMQCGIFTDYGVFRIQNNLSTAVTSAHPKRDQVQWVTTGAYILATFQVTLSTRGAAQCPEEEL